MKYSLIILLVFSTCSADGQGNLQDLHRRLDNAKEDTVRVNTLNDLAQYYSHIDIDSSISYAKQSLLLAEKSNYLLGKFMAFRRIYFAETFIGDYEKAMLFALKQLKTAEQFKDSRLAKMAQSHLDLGYQNRIVGNYPAAFKEFQEAFRLQNLSEQQNKGLFGSAYSQMAIIFLAKNEKDSALRYARQGYDFSTQAEAERMENALVLSLAILGNALQANGQYKLAEKCFREAIDRTLRVRNFYSGARLYKDIAKFFYETNKIDSSIYYAKASLKLCNAYGYINYGMEASSVLSQVYESQHQPDSALKYMKLTMAANDSIFSRQKLLRIQLLTIDENQRQQEILAAQERYRAQIRTGILLAALGVFLVIALILFRNYRLQKKAKSQIEHAYQELKSTQAQLIQSEKMASLGELTAGIAHEIQNPLNFVNNFSEVNNELLVEMKEELIHGNPEGAKTIADDIIGNGIKILTHGKRADAIVKGMLQHTMESKGQKEPTDLNALADEYFRLIYQGQRARDNSFNASLGTEFDPEIGKINIVPQDIRRVLLNLYNNAFYAISEKKKLKPDHYEPTVSISTRKIRDKVEIRVKDNGCGIPLKIVDKIFQPFFTTKPTGQGTGLGLSLSYDIIKAHGGEIKVDTREGEYTEFVILIPG